MTLYDEQLFGAPPGDLKGITLGMSWNHDGRGSVVLNGHPVSRRQLLTVTVNFDDRAKTTSIIGALTPVLHRASAADVRYLRRQMWALHNRLGAQGYEVGIANCGREARK